MQYFECILNTPEIEIDARCDELTALGVDGFVVESESDFRNFLENNHQYWDYVDQELEDRFAGISRLKFYLTDDEDGQGILRAVQARYPSVSTSKVADSDWENNWREYYQPIEVGKQLIIVPEWEDIPKSERRILRLDPGLIFGTGSHATTRMCLQALERASAPGRRVLDLGCGSGILGIGALVLGCDCCLGVDIDPKAPDVACANAALNGFGADRFRVLAGDLLRDSSLRKNLGLSPMSSYLFPRMPGNSYGMLESIFLPVSSRAVRMRSGPQLKLPDSVSPNIFTKMTGIVLFLQRFEQRQ